jgi:hypothetical protein
LSIAKSKKPKNGHEAQNDLFQISGAVAGEVEKMPDDVRAILEWAEQTKGKLPN